MPEFNDVTLFQFRRNGSFEFLGFKSKACQQFFPPESQIVTTSINFAWLLVGLVWTLPASEPINERRRSLIANLWRGPEIM
jgi:hypothetical protein